MEIVGPLEFDPKGFPTHNPITVPWVPVRAKDGSHRRIAPWQMAHQTLAGPDWPRADLDLACYELLIEPIFLADSPAAEDVWRARRAPDPGRPEARLPHARQPPTSPGSGGASFRVATRSTARRTRPTCSSSIAPVGARPRTTPIRSSVAGAVRRWGPLRRPWPSMRSRRTPRRGGRGTAPSRGAAGRW
ncbi:MAG: type I-E CRISPR-associated protein Cse1/CasA [Shimia sp.]